MAFLKSRGVGYYLFCLLGLTIKFFEQRISLKGLKNHYLKVSCFLLRSFYQFISVSFFCDVCMPPPCLLKMQTSGPFVHWISISEKDAQDSGSLIIRPEKFHIK